MDKLHWVTSTLGIVLALGLTRLLATGVALFQARDRLKMDWVPIVWAVCIFVMLLQLSWATLYLGRQTRIGRSHGFSPYWARRPCSTLRPR